MADDYLGDIPGIHTQQAQMESVAAGDATEEQVMFQAPFDCLWAGLFVTPDADVAGNDTNRKNLNVKDKGTDGNGTSTVTGAFLNLAAGTNLDQADQRAITPTTPLRMVEGQVLAMEIEQVGGGVALPRMSVLNRFRPDNNPA